MDIFAYYYGLILVIILIFLGIDDLLWDIATAPSKARYEENRVQLSKLDDKTPKLLAIVIAAWHEEAVLGAVVNNIIASVQYPRSMYHIFLGVYPNDDPTIAVAERLAAQHFNIHVIKNVKPGPTSKADNLNNVFHQIQLFEAEHSWRFAGITVHDSEDVMHPYELKITNYLYDKYDALQFPVFPLQEMPHLNTLFAKMTTGTYADEFAENHYRIMVTRDIVGGFVPSAGTGFALSHKLLDHFLPNDNIFPENSLTEDYKLSLTLHQNGFRVHYVLEKVQRLQNDGSLVWEYVSTRSMFPSTFWAAVRQKTRWIYGITMQSFDFSAIFAPNLEFTTRYTMYKDWKAKFANLLVLPGYILFIYFICTFFWDLPDVYPDHSLGWWLCVVLTFMMLERQALRAVAIANIYGTKSAFIACFLPPLLPLRLVWGNIINLIATIRAWGQALTISTPRKKVPNARPVWSKTDHEFLSELVLKRFHRNLGDVLLEKQFITPTKLRAALDTSLSTKKRLGLVLLEENIVAEENLLRALALVQQTIYIHIYNNMIIKKFSLIFNYDFLKVMLAFPLLSQESTYIFAISDYTSTKALEVIKAEYSLSTIKYVYATRESILSALEKLYAPSFKETIHCQQVQHLFDLGNINYEQTLIVKYLAGYKKLSDTAVMNSMGLYQNKICMESVL